MNTIRKLLAVVIVFTMILSIAAPAMAADPPAAIFYDEDGTTILASLPTVAVPNATGSYYIDWKQLNNVPDFNQANDKVILKWKLKGGADAQYIFNNNSSRSNTVAADIARGRLIPLTSNLELVPFTTMPKSEFDTIIYGNMVVDGHMDAPMSIMTSSSDWRPAESKDLSLVDGRTGTSQALYPWMKAGGMSGGLFAAYTGGYTNEDYRRGSGDRANSRILALTNATHWSAERNPTMMQLVREPSEFADAFAAGNIGIMQSIEGCYALTPENCEELIEQYYDLGIRVISFTWNPNSYLAAGNLMADPSPFNTTRWDGFSDLGYRALEKMDELGIVYDVSHSSDQTVRDALAATSNPIMASHSGARAVYDNVRNLWDEEIIGIAKSGGAIFQNLYGDFMEEPRTVSEMVDQIDHIKTLLTAEGMDWSDHVCVGSDYDGGTNVANANDARYYYRIGKEMLARGYTAADLKKVFGTNAFRIMNTVQGNATATHRDGTAVISAPTANGVVLGRGLTYAQLNTREPSFSANVTGAVSARVIVDGIVYPSNLSGGTITASLVGTPLQEAFHVVTFEATDMAGKVSRDTKIFYVGDVPAIHKVEFMDTDGETLLKTVYVDNNGTINAADIPQAAANGSSIIGWRDLRLTETFNFATTLTRSYRLVAIDPVSFTSNAQVVWPDDNFALNAKFNVDLESNAAILTYTFDESKFDFVTFTPASGVTVVAEDVSNGVAKITVSTLNGYDLQEFGDLTLHAKSDAAFTGDPETFDLNVEYVLRDGEVKTIQTAIAEVSVLTPDPSRLQGDTNDDGVIDLIDLSNIIDWYGIDSSNPEWNSLYAYFDFNNDGSIDIFDITWIAVRIQ